MSMHALTVNGEVHEVAAPFRSFSLTPLIVPSLHKAEERFVVDSSAAFSATGARRLDLSASQQVESIRQG